jgi:hypothetical protein
VYHIDGGAVAALTHYYAETIPPKSDILDICSSWVMGLFLWLRALFFFATCRHFVELLHQRRLRAFRFLSKGMRRDFFCAHVLR